MGNLELTSPAFENYKDMPMKYTCQDEEISPPLEIKGIPENTKSLVLTMEDPDTPIRITITHWVVFNIDPKTEKIEEGTIPKNAIVGKNLMQKNKYMGPCPPWGRHRYIFKLFALDTMLSLDSKSRKKAVLKAMDNHILEQTELVGLYARQKKK
ncbi:MAG: YbhB/YbcL family Raf kinase inhibitor-like protein [Asgard group archaeon]|nr:YbhB/YbcL family Raf kinase inhibitor-like protein [Asgard group archaeon]